MIRDDDRFDFHPINDDKSPLNYHWLPLTCWITHFPSGLKREQLGTSPTERGT